MGDLFVVRAFLTGKTVSFFSSANYYFLQIRTFQLKSFFYPINEFNTINNIGCQRNIQKFVQE